MIRKQKTGAKVNEIIVMGAQMGSRVQLLQKDIVRQWAFINSSNPVRFLVKPGEKFQLKVLRVGKKTQKRKEVVGGQIFKVKQND